MSVNKLTAVGRLTADPVLSQFGDASCATFTQASDTRTKDVNGDNITNFYRCNTWRRMSEVAMQYLHKGDKITVVGDLTIRQYKDKNGMDRTAVQINVTDLELPAHKTQTTSGSSQEDDLPI